MDPSSQNNVICDSWAEFFRSVSESSLEHHSLLIDCGSITTNHWTTLTRQKSSSLPFQMPHESEAGDGLIASVSSTPDIDITNAMILVSRMQNEFCLMKNLKGTVSSMKTSVFKVENALNNENKLKEQLSDMQQAELSDAEAETCLAGVKLPKLGKVYAELASVMKACSEAMEVLFQSSSKVIHKLERLRMQCSSWRGKMLLCVKWLILARLENIGLLASLYRKTHIDHSDMFFTRESKQFCKLIAIYNKSCVDHMKLIEMKECLDNMCIKRLADSVSGQVITAEWKGFQKNFILESFSYVTDFSPITVNAILDMLSKYSMKDIGHQVIKILNTSLLKKSPSPSQGSSSCIDVIQQGSTWKLASKIEIRPMQSRSIGMSFHRVIKRVANITLPSIILEDCERECSSLLDIFDSQEAIISHFLAGLGGKTKILRNFGENVVPDDAASVASASSRASSSLAYSTEFKSVSWKDSYNSEALKTITSKHLDHMADSLSELCLDCGNYFDYLKFSAKADLDLFIMQASISNLKCLDNLSNKVCESLSVAASNIIVEAAQSCSDYVMCEMLGRMTPHFDKPSLQYSKEIQHLSLTTSLCISALQPLLHNVECYPNNSGVTRIGIPSILSVLSKGYYFIASKIQHFISTQDLSNVLILVLNDLRTLTGTAINSLKIVEECHNEIEKRRNHDSATLILSTKYLHDIDSLITKMQITSTTTMAQVSKMADKKCSKILTSHFPLQKIWIQKNSIDNEVKNKYVHEIINGFAKDVCLALVGMDTQFQLAGIVPIVSAVFEAILKHIAYIRMKFSVQGGLQLKYDLSVLCEFFSSEDNGLHESTRDVLRSLQSVKKALEVVQLLCSTNISRAGEESSSYQRPSSRNYNVSQSESIMELDDEFWLSLRRDGKGSKRWSSFLPCLD